MIAPVTKIFNSDKGKRIFHPSDNNWSYLGLGKDALNKIKNSIKTNVFIKNQTTGGRNAGPSHPPKNKVTVNAEISVIPKYSPTKNIPNFILEYSE